MSSLSLNLCILLINERNYPPKRLKMRFLRPLNHAYNAQDYRPITAPILQLFEG